MIQDLICFNLGELGILFMILLSFVLIQPEFYSHNSISQMFIHVLYVTGK